MSSILFKLLALNLKYLQSCGILDIMLDGCNIVYPAVDDKADLFQVSLLPSSKPPSECQCLVVDCFVPADVVDMFWKEGIWVKISKLGC